MINRNIFDDIGYFDEDLEVCEDYDLWLRISLKYKIFLIDLPLLIKHGGHENQLGFKYWGMDRFRVKSLQKNYHNIKNDKQKKLIKNMLIKKLELLIIGAKKYNRFEMIEKYKKELKEIL